MGDLLSAQNMLTIGPATGLTVVGLLVLCANLMRRGGGGARALEPALAVAGVLLTAWATLYIPYTDGVTTPGLSGFGGMALFDDFTIFLTAVILGILVLVILSSTTYMADHGIGYGEYYALLMFAGVGMVLMASSGDLVMVFLALETMSIGTYVMAGLNRKRWRSNEAALKYFLLGAFASGFLLYGMALLYGAAGTTNLIGIGRAYASLGAAGELYYIAGVGLLLIGLAFKVSAVPFHMWTPDVYMGAPTPVTALMAAGVKAAAFAAMMRIVYTAFEPAMEQWTSAVAALAVLTMIVGNVLAIVQSNIKRLLAYSSIAHAGYLLVAVVAGGAEGVASVLFYLVAYAVMNIGAFGVVAFLSRGGAGARDDGEYGEALDDYAGLASQRPLLAAMMAIFMFSLAGIPPTAGFIGKFMIFSAAVKADYYGLAIIGVLASLVSVYYYLRVVVVMYMKDPEGDESAEPAPPAPPPGKRAYHPAQAPEPMPLFSRGPGLAVTLLVTAILTLWLGIQPGRWLDFATRSAVNRIVTPVHRAELMAPPGGDGVETPRTTSSVH